MAIDSLPAALRLASSAACAAVLALLASDAMAQSVVKCVDGEGNVTYQNAPCDKGQAGRPMDVPKAEARDETSAWEAAAREARVVRGMPKRWVLRSRGNPAEIRPGGPREEASEVWRYAARDGVSMLVGFAGPNVAWVRDGARPTAGAMPPAANTAGAASGASAPAGAAGGAAPIVGAQNRRFVIAGRYCDHVFAEIGPADRDTVVAAGAETAAGKRYVYEPAPGDPSMRTLFSCIDGRVADVERTMVR